MRIEGVSLVDPLGPLETRYWSIFTARKRSCGKVKFSQVSISHPSDTLHPERTWDQRYPTPRRNMWPAIPYPPPRKDQGLGRDLAPEIPYPPKLPPDAYENISCTKLLLPALKKIEDEWLHYFTLNVLTNATGLWAKHIQVHNVLTLLVIYNVIHDTKLWPLSFTILRPFSPFTVSFTMLHCDHYHFLKSLSLWIRVQNLKYDENKGS